MPSPALEMSSEGQLFEVSQGVSLLLQRQLEAQQRMLESQHEIVEFQREILRNIMRSPGATKENTGPWNHNVPLPSTRTEVQLEEHEQTSEADRQHSPAGKNCSPDSRDVEDSFKNAKRHAPWNTEGCPAESTWFKAGAMRMSPIDYCIPFDLQGRFTEVCLAAMSPSRFKVCFISSLEQLVLFLVLLMSVIIPCQMDRKIPETSLQVIVNLLLSLSSVCVIVGTIISMSLYKFSNMMPAENFHSWVSANKGAIMCANLNSSLSAWLMIITSGLQYYDGIIQADFSDKVFGDTPAIILYPLFSGAIIITTTFFLQVAARSAVFTGALADKRVPVPSSTHVSSQEVAKGFFGVMMGGQNQGFRDMLCFYTEVKQLEKHGVAL